MSAARPALVRSAAAVPHLRVLLLSGIATVLVTRGFLEAAGYPKLGGGGLHIAHVLWGGLLLLAGLAGALVFVGRAAQFGAALVGGVGFGLFIDEVGKFVTERTDYFYRPAAGIMYVAFAALALLVGLLRRRARDEPGRHTADAVHLALVGVTSGLTPARHAAALRLVEGSDREEDLAVARLLAAVPPRETRWDRRRQAATVRIHALLTPARRARLVAVSIAVVVALPLSTVLGAVGEALAGDLVQDRELGASLVVVAAAVVSSVLCGWALVLLRRNRTAAFRLLRLSLLVNLLVGQVFTFVVNQFAAVAAVGLGVLLLAVLKAGSGEREDRDRHLHARHRLSPRASPMRT